MTKDLLDPKHKYPRFLDIEYTDIQHEINCIKSYIDHNLVPDCLDGIIAINRGGLIPAAMLSYQTRLPIKYVINAKSYDEDNQQREIKLSNIPDITKQIQKRLLIVDDILDTGQTLLAIEKQLPDCHFTVVISKMKRFTAHNSTRRIWTLAALANYMSYSTQNLTDRIYDDKWLNFPWETSERGK